MRRNTLRRAGVVGVTMAAAGITAFGFATTANAEVRYSNSDVVITGGTATAINQCINTASESLTVDQQNFCTQIATAGNVLVFDTVNITIFGGNGKSKRQTVSFDRISAEILGTEVQQVKRCVSDNTPGKRGQGQGQAARKQRPCEARGDSLQLANVDVALTRP